MTDGGTFTLVASNFLGTATSKGAVLTPVGVPPSITMQPYSVTNLCDETAILFVEAEGVVSPGLPMDVRGAAHLRSDMPSWRSPM